MRLNGIKTLYIFIYKGWLGLISLHLVTQEAIMDYLKEFNAKLQSLDRSKSIETVFRDFLTLSTYSLAQPFYRSEEIEQKYIETVKNYTKEQANEFPKMLALLVSALEEKHQDFLGQVYSLNNFGNANKGQFFTPYHISKMMAEINMPDIENQLENYDYVTLSEPCCGSGGMIIAFAESLKSNGYNYQHQLYVEAIDIDELCFKMTYIQLSLLGIPAKVIRGDSLAVQHYEVLYTPFYFIADFPAKFKKQEQINKMRNLFKEPEPYPMEKEKTKITTNRANQLSLFNF